MSPERVAPAHKVRALLFDFGGTLAFLDYEFLAVEFGRLSLKTNALALECAEYRGREALDRFLMSGGEAVNHEPGWRAYFTGWLDALGVPRDAIDECAHRFRALHEADMLWRVIRPGTIETLERLKSAGLKLAIVSNADGRVERYAHRFGLAPFFHAIIDSSVVGVAKPDPRIFRIALEQLGVHPAQALYAGDVYAIDVLGAGAAGITAKLIDQLGDYTWVDHERIRDISELYQIG